MQTVGDSNRNMFADCFYAFHTHQLEFANLSLPCEGRFRHINIFVLIYANEGSNDVVPLKQYNTQSQISQEILKQCSLNLALQLYITKETK